MFLGVLNTIYLNISNNLSPRKLTSLWNFFFFLSRMPRKLLNTVKFRYADHLKIKTFYPLKTLSAKFKLFFSSFSTLSVPLIRDHLWDCPKVVFKTTFGQSQRWSYHRHFTVIGIKQKKNAIQLAIFPWNANFRLSINNSYSVSQAECPVSFSSIR